MKNKLFRFCVTLLIVTTCLTLFSFSVIGQDSFTLSNTGKNYRIKSQSNSELIEVNLLKKNKTVKQGRVVWNGADYQFISKQKRKIEIVHNEKIVATIDEQPRWKDIHVGDTTYRMERNAGLWWYSVDGKTVFSGLLTRKNGIRRMTFDKRAINFNEEIVKVVAFYDGAWTDHVNGHRVISPLTIIVLVAASAVAAL